MVRAPGWADEFTELSPEALAERAVAARQRRGNRITYSPHVVIPVRIDDVEAVLRLARRGAEAGCHEARLTAPDAERFPLGLDDVLAVCHLIVDETGLLTIPPAEALSAETLAPLRAVAPSQSVRIGFDREVGLDLVEAAGQLQIPLTVEVVVLATDGQAEQVDLLLSLGGSHERHGHLQAVALQPSRGGGAPAADPLPAITLARALLPADVSVVPPSAGPVDPGRLLQAGIDDWGGLALFAGALNADGDRAGASPLDHLRAVNGSAGFAGDRPRGSPLDHLRAATESAGFALIPRLPLHPRYATDLERWVDPGLHFAVLDRSDAEGFARDDPGAVLPHRFAAWTGDDAGVPIGPRSTAWFAGAGHTAPLLLPAPPAATGRLREVLDGIEAGEEVGEEELLVLFAARGREVAAVAHSADALRRRLVGETVTWVRAWTIDLTDGGVLEDLTTGAARAAGHGVTEVCLEGRLRPDADPEHHLYLVRAVKAAAPGMRVWAFTAADARMAAGRLDEPLDHHLRRLREAGLAGLLGTTAGVLDDSVRSRIFPEALSADGWLDVHRSAHAAGLRSPVSLLLGSVERPVHWARHLLRIRALQRETAGFTAFVPRPLIPMAAPLYREQRTRRGPTFREVLLLHAAARIAFRDLVRDVTLPLAALGDAGAAQALQAGANDLGSRPGAPPSGTVRRRRKEDPDEVGLRRLVDPLGRPLRRRTD